MNTKNTFHIISLERKMIWVPDVICDHFSTGHTHFPTQSYAHMYFRLSLPCVPLFSRMLPICRKSGHVSATLTNELRHTLLWMVGRRIGSAIIRSRKTKIVCLRVYFWKRFSLFLGNSRTDDHPPIEKPVEGNDTWIQEEKWEQLLLQISNSAGTLCRCHRGLRPA